MSTSALEILTELRELGVELWVDGERLRFRAPAGVLAPNLRDRLLSHRAEVMALLRSAGHSGPEDRIPRVPRDGEQPSLSYAQERMWFLSQLEADSNRYIEAEAFRIRGAVDLTALRDALTEIVRRHENLRTVFPTVGGRPVQIVQPALPVNVRLIDASTCPTADWESRIAEAVRHERAQVFDLATGPLLRVMLLRLAADYHVLVVVMHHILGDAWSRIVLGRELAVLYRAFTHGEPSPLPELPIQYADYAHWERHRLQGDRLAGLLDHWTQRLAGAPMLALPGERGEGDRDTDRTAPVSEEYPLRIEPELTAALRALSVQAHASLFMTLTAAFATLLHRYGDQRDISLGTEVANRAHPDTEPLIGLLVNQLVLRIDLSGDPPFRELLHRVRAVAVDAFGHQDLPFEQLVEALQPERRVGHQPLFRAGLSLENAQPALPTLDGVEIERIRLDYGALYDLFLFLTEEPDRVEGALIYDPARVDGAVIGRLLDNFGCLLRSVVVDPDRPLSELDLLTPHERRDVLERWNDTGDAGLEVTAVHHQFERQVRRTPDRTAVVHNGAELTYRQLNEAANRLAHRLLADGLRPEELVGIFLPPSIDRIVCTYAILKAGGAMVFLDPQYPQNRLAQMLDEARLSGLFTTRELAAALPPNDVGRVHVDADPSDGPGPVHDPGVPVHADQLVYAIFTSGTTGLPKRIGFTHRAFANLLAWQNDQPGLTGPATTLQFSTFGFCVSFQEIFSTLSGGGRLVLAPTEARIEPESLVELLRREQVQRLYLPFAALKMLAQSACHNGTYPTGLQAVVTAGEQLQVTDELRTLFENLPSASLHNQYGASETHVVTSHVLGGPPARWPALAPIGRPNRNNRIYLLDHHLRPVPVGIPGDLYVAGTGLLRGYLDDPALTAAKVVADPFGPEPGSRMYRTGDLGAWLPDGTLRHLGRVDDQVKVRGFRIELGDIETSLRRRSGVRDVAVVVRGTGPTGPRVVAYLVLDDAVLTSDDLWAQIERDLPAHMIPAAMVVLPELPVNANGKLDRERLPEPPPDAHRRPSTVPFVAPRTPLERQLAEVIADVLGLPEVGIHDDFFDRGGHSLLATQAVLRIRDALGVDLPVRAFFDGPTIAELTVRLVEAQLEAVGQARATEAMAVVTDPVLAAADESLVTRRTRSTYDVIVVGARCAGASTALLLARQGLRVLLLERATFPRDTVSSHMVWQPGIAQLHRWGLLDRLVATGCPPIRTVTTDYGDFPLTGTPPAVYGVGAAYAPLRTVLDPLLAEAARQVGAEVREGCTVQGLLVEDGVVAGVSIRTPDGERVERAPLVIGADGLNSVVAESVKAAEYHVRPPVACYYYGYWRGVPTDRFTMYLRERRMYASFPTHDDLTVVIVGWPQEEFGRVRQSVQASWDEALRLVPELDDRLRAGQRHRPLIGAGPQRNLFRRSYGPGWALVGDAGHSKDPHSARGITDALRDAELLADAVVAGLSGRERLGVALARYERQRDELALPLYETNYQAAELTAPSARQFAARQALRGDQEEIDRLLGVMTGAVQLQQLRSAAGGR